MTENVLLRRLLAVHDGLRAAGLPHAFGGAIALAFHVQDPRATSDIDVNVTASASDPAAILSALPAQVRWDDDDVRRCRRDGQVRVRWQAPTGSTGPPETPVDVFLPQHPRLHEQAVDRAQWVPILGVQVPILGATDLMVFKMWFDRRKDWADIEEMLRYGKPDADEAAAWITELLGSGDPRLVTLREVQRDVRDQRG